MRTPEISELQDERDVCPENVKRYELHKNLLETNRRNAKEMLPDLYLLMAYHSLTKLANACSTHVLQVLDHAFLLAMNIGFGLTRFPELFLSSFVSQRFPQSRLALLPGLVAKCHDRRAD